MEPGNIRIADLDSPANKICANGAVLIRFEVLSKKLNDNRSPD